MIGVSRVMWGSMVGSGCPRPSPGSCRGPWSWGSSQQGFGETDELGDPSDALRISEVVQALGMLAQGLGDAGQGSVPGDVARVWLSPAPELLVVDGPQRLP